MRQTAPRVSIGLPVRNGAAFLDQTLDDLLRQTWTDLEVVVCDNASTDGTPTICAAWQRRDPRVRYHRSDTDRGPAANYNWAFQLSVGQYFCWSAADDRHLPEFVASTVAALEGDPTAVVASTGTRRIGPANEDKGVVRGQPDLSSLDAAERLRTLLFVDHRRHGAFEIFGMIRRDALAAVGPQGRYARADSVQLVKLALRGRFVHVPKALFLNRDHEDRSVRVAAPRAYGGRSWTVQILGGGPTPPDAWWDAARADRVVWPEWRLLQEYRRAVEQAPLSPADRSACRRVLAAFAVHHVPKLTRDLLIGAEFAARRAFSRGKRSPHR